MEEFWARFIESSGQPGLSYWEYFAERLAQLSNIPDSSNILDIGTYDGNVLIKAMDKIGVQGCGVGADIDSDGFQEGVANAMQRGWEDKVVFVQTDANALGFKSEIFDTVLANFVGWDDCFDFERLEFIGSDKMMAEIKRVLRPGGQVGIGAWVDQSDIEWIGVAFEEYLPECDKNISCYAKENPEGQKMILQSSGFENIRTHVVTTHFISSDAELWWQQMQYAANSYFRLNTDPNILKRIKEQVFADLREFQNPDGIRFSKTVSFVFGTKPI